MHIGIEDMDMGRIESRIDALRALRGKSESLESYECRVNMRTEFAHERWRRIVAKNPGLSDFVADAIAAAREKLRKNGRNGNV
jgi:hypothetical protein